MEISLVEFDSTFLEKTWEWLSDPEIKQLTNTPNFSKEDQFEWFKSLVTIKDTYKIWGLKYNNTNIGACGLKNITDVDCEYWGYIGEKSFWGIGIGQQLVKRLIDEAVSLGKESVWLTVRKDNIRAISLYNKTGFVIDNSYQNDLLFKMRLSIKK